MGGIGSGRKSTGRTTVEDCKRVDIRYFRRHNLIKPDTVGTLRWTCRGEPSGDIRYQVTAGTLILTYRYRYAGGEWQPVRQEIALITTPCHFGGRRYWLSCPGCQRCCAVLCCDGRLFLCRHCYRLPYQSQLENGFGRACLRRSKLEEQLYDHSQKRRWKSSTDKLVARLVAAEEEVNQVMAARLGHIEQE